MWSKRQEKKVSASPAWTAIQCIPQAWRSLPWYIHGVTLSSFLDSHISLSECQALEIIIVNTRKTICFQFCFTFFSPYFVSYKESGSMPSQDFVQEPPVAHGLCSWESMELGVFT